ncbi:MAG: hypothetical protein WBZ33_01940 [Thermoactinomyces sp.]
MKATAFVAATKRKRQTKGRTRATCLSEREFCRARSLVLKRS